jgi:hypothetical protein
MKRKRGRPKGKSYPEPQTSAEGFDIALYGKLGASEAMSLLRDCPYPTIDFIKKKAPKTRDRVDKKLLKLAPKIAERWLRRIDPSLGQAEKSLDINVSLRTAWHAGDCAEIH